MTTSLTTKQLPEQLQAKVARICNQEAIRPEQVRFIERTPDYFGMYEGDQWTGWGYYPAINEID